MRRLLLGLAAHVPVLDGWVVNRGTGGTDRADYCYGVWLKHLTLLVAAGPRRVPESLAELGPGDSLGVGLAALLCGTNVYRALDVKRFAEPTRDERILDELVELFSARAPRPTAGWPDFDEHLDGRLFPSAILSDALLERTLAPERVEAIRRALHEGVSADGSITIRCIVPWESVVPHPDDAVQLILSHSVLEHVRDLQRAARASFRWLAPGGWASHQIDLTSHGLARAWNGAWGIRSEAYWRLLSEKRDCWINRQPASAQLAALQDADFDVVRVRRRSRQDGIPRKALAGRWRDLSDDDLTTSGLFVQARRPGTRVAD